MKLKTWFLKGIRELPGLRKQTFSVLKATLGIAGPCALILLLVCIPEAMSAVNAWPAGAGAFVSLAKSFLIMPLAAGMITYAAGASWEGRRASINDAAQLARIRFREIMITGLAAGGIMLLADWLAGAVYSLIGMIPALLGWIPVVGQAVTGAAAFIVQLISQAVEFAALAVLTAGMLALTADGISGKAQIRRAAGVMLGGGEQVIDRMILAFCLWAAVYGLYALALWALPDAAGAAAGAVLAAALEALSMTAISVIYLTQRDKQDGMRFHV